jgi:pilus assembly protein CpaC
MNLPEVPLMRIPRALTLLLIPGLLFLFLCAGLGQPAQAAPHFALGSVAPDEIDVGVGKSVVLENPRTVSRVSIADPGIADVKVLDERTIYLTGKNVGETNLMVWSKGESLSVYTVFVEYEMARLKSMMHRILPHERMMRVFSMGENVILAGEVSSAESLASAVSLAESYAPEKVINQLSVSGVHQVMLEVRVAEMSKSLARRLGVNLAAIGEGFLLDGKLFHTFLNNLTGFDEEGRFVISDQIDFAGTYQFGSTDISVFIDAMKENGLVKILAEPNLICLSGQEANFLAGGEFPIPVPQGLGTVAIEYKEFGVGLTFTPTVLSPDRINLVVAPEVSQLDFTNAISFTGAVIPALTTRRASTTIELKDGQSFAIAGLIQDEMRELVNKVPLLGEIPVLGALFRSSEYRKNQTELIIIVTPKLARPLNLAEQAMPYDGFTEPNDVEFYLFGQLEGDPHGQSGRSASSGAEFDGQLGHVVPE